MQRDSKGKLISIVVPLHNEAGNIRPLYNELTKIINKLPQHFEMIFVDDGSRDSSILELEKLRIRDKRILIVELVRNFGKEIALTAGLQATSGEAAIMMDADLQHPPKLIPKFITHWERGSEAVVGVRKNNDGQSRLKAWFSKKFYQVINRISSTEIKPDATDFRLLDKIVVQEFNRFTEHNRLTRGLIDWLGTKQDYIYFTAPPRYKGEASYTFSKLVKLALNGITSHSLFPLRLAGYLGAFIVLTSGPLGLFIIIERFVLDDPLELRFTGPAMLAVLILFLIGIVLVCMGLSALYIANIYDEVMGRPLYSVRRPRNRKARNSQ